MISVESNKAVAALTALEEGQDEPWKRKIEGRTLFLMWAMGVSIAFHIATLMLLLQLLGK